MPLPGGLGLTSVAVGDLNGDGKLDMVGINPARGAIGVLLGKGDGTFQPTVYYAAGTNPRSLVLGDFNHDGKLDLAVANAGGVSILLGKGDGTFSTTFFNYAAGPDPEYITAGDFNGDGKLDLVVANRANNTVSILLGKGDGSFRAPISYAAGQAPDSIAVGDFNGDGKLDLAVADFNGGSPGKVAVLMGNGDGTFQAPVTYNTSGGGAQSVIATDFNGDGKVDLAVANFDFSVSILLGKGDGTFLPAVNYTSVGRGPLVAGNFNNDGHLDLAVLNSGNNQVGILSGNGDGTFQPPGFSPTGTTPTALAVGDFNGDHLPDLVTGNGVLLDIPRAMQFNVSVSPTGSALTGTPLTITITAQDNFLNTATGYTGTVSLTSSDPQATLPNTYTFTAADHGTHTFTNGLTFWTTGAETVTATDSATNITGGASITVAQGSSPSAPAFSSLNSVVVGERPVSMVVADLNGDGKLDVITANFGDFQHPGNGSISVLLGKGDGTFQPVQTLNVGLATPIALAAGDFNGDGKVDLAMANFATGDVTIFLGNGDGTFHFSNSFSVGGHALALATADVNGDHKADLVVTYATGAQIQNGGAVAVFLGKGDGTFLPGPTYAVGNEPDAITVGDFNGDGKVDFAVANGMDNTVSVMLGKGDGTFKVGSTYSVGNAPIALKAADVSGDGKVDLVVVNATSSNVSVLLGKGDGTFQPAINYALGEDPEGLAIADVNGDGKPDLVVTTNFDQPTGTVSVLLGNGNGTFQSPTNYPVGPGPVPVAVADLNGDRLPDLIVGNAGKNQTPAASVSVLVNPGSSQIQFSAPTYTVEEGAGAAVITLTRTGDTSGTATLHYATSNRVALAGVDYVPVSGVLTFNSGETSKSFSITLKDDAQVEGVETVSLTLSNPTGGASLVGGPAQAVLNIRDDNDGTANQRYVAQLYQDLLHRPADAGGLAYWSSRLNNGMARSQLTQLLVSSGEFLSQEVQQLYLTYLGRPADLGGLNAFVASLSHGGTVEQVKATIIGSPEYFSRAGGTNIGFVTAMYHDLLGRDPDAGAAIWTTRLNAGMSRPSAALGIIKSLEGMTYLVQTLYQRYLHRQADAGGIAGFTAALSRGMHDEQVISTLVASNEYFTSI
jgi:hypothetical protein